MTPYYIAKEIGRSQSTVALSLRKLKDLGLVRKSRGGAWFLPPEKEKIAEFIVTCEFKAIPKQKLEELEKEKES